MHPFGLLATIGLLTKLACASYARKHLGVKSALSLPYVRLPPKPSIPSQDNSHRKVTPSPSKRMRVSRSTEPSTKPTSLTPPDSHVAESGNTDSSPSRTTQHETRKKAKIDPTKVVNKIKSMIGASAKKHPPSKAVLARFQWLQKYGLSNIPLYALKGLLEAFSRDSVYEAQAMNVFDVLKEVKAIASISLMSIFPNACLSESTRLIRALFPYVSAQQFLFVFRNYSLSFTVRELCVRHLPDSLLAICLAKSGEYHDSEHFDYFLAYSKDKKEILYDVLLWLSSRESMPERDLSITKLYKVLLDNDASFPSVFAMKIKYMVRNRAPPEHVLKFYHSFTQESGLDKITGVELSELLHVFSCEKTYENQAIEVIDNLRKRNLGSVEYALEKYPILSNACKSGSLTLVSVLCPYYNIDSRLRYAHKYSNVPGVLRTILKSVRVAELMDAIKIMQGDLDHGLLGSLTESVQYMNDTVERVLLSLKVSGKEHARLSEQAEAHGTVH